MTHASNHSLARAQKRALRRSAVCTSLLLWLVAGCSGSRLDELNTNNIGRSDAAVLVDEDAEGEGPNEGDDGGDFDAIVSVQVADAGEEPDTTVVVETALCGNGQLDTGEECDQGANNSDTAAGACRVNCRNAYCGDGVVDEGEACDHGASNADGEANACRTNCTAARCGDNVVDTGEQCDSGDARSDTVAGACRLDCHSARCGDGVVDTDEGCDDGNAVDTDMCRNTCRSARCGDHVVDPEEQCDDGNNTSGDGCQATCRTPRCGDRVMDTGEQCDDGNIVENDGCRSNCRSGCVSDAACADGAFCNGIERCLNGLCNPGAPLNRSDNIPCTQDSCDEGQDRITHIPDDSLCNVPGPTCNEDDARRTTRTMTCSATSGCVELATTTTCSDAPSVCQRRGDGSYTLLTYAPVCEDTMSCGDATSNSNSVVCAHIPASCTDRVFTGRATATCDADAESCGNNAPNMDDCKTRDSTSCAAGNVSFTRVTGTCGANGCGSTTTGPTACSDPADICTNAHRRTYAPTCNPSTGCGTERVVVDADCGAFATSCGAAGANQAPAVQRYTPQCDSNNPGQCLNGGAAQPPEYCQGRGPVCASVGGVPSVTNYVAACSGAACADGGIAQGQPLPCGAAPSTCGANPNGPRGALQQIVYTAACQDGSSCYPNGRPAPTDCTAAAATCQIDGQSRAYRMSYSAACNTAGTACVQNGVATQTYCDQEPTFCNANGQPVDTENKCSGNGCVQTTGATCPTNQRWVCSNTATSSLRRLQQGGCQYGPGCTYTDTATAETCVRAQCVPPIEGNIFSSCGGCALNSDGVATCRSAQTCTTCTNGCNQTTGLCNVRIIVDPTLGGVGTLGGGGILVP